MLGSGPVNGVLLGAAMSIVLLLRQGGRPRVIELARVPGTTHFADRLRHPENQQIPGVLVIRCESALLYFNLEYVRERVLDILAKRPDGVGLVVFYLGAFPESICLAPSCWQICTERFARARSSSGWPTRTAKCGTRFAESGSSRSTGRSKRVRLSISS